MSGVGGGLGGGLRYCSLLWPLSFLPLALLPLLGSGWGAAWVFIGLWLAAVADDVLLCTLPAVVGWQ